MRRVLLDESVPRQLGKVLDGYEVETVQGAGWAGLKNGELLRSAMERFDVLVTADCGFKHQQNLQGIGLAVLLLISRSNRLSDLLPLVPALRRAIDSAESGHLIEIS